MLQEINACGSARKSGVTPLFTSFQVGAVYKDVDNFASLYCTLFLSSLVCTAVLLLSQLLKILTVLDRSTATQLASTKSE